ncbi:hypothetical protein A8135_09300 [Legionella jamestowniensis]|uniref:Uncharacterized protein n=1 Tax=Legionella jamestowniensis TaxID=455 RepID=A0ABX2XWC8_9GAMM|nr:hypothetical protein A8135_09300 [Legionella jamestowniensis]
MKKILTPTFRGLSAESSDMARFLEPAVKSLNLIHISADAPRLDRGVQGFCAKTLDPAVKPRDVGK